MKKLEDIFIFLFTITYCLIGLFIIYKIFVGIFYLLNKLIDKI